MLGKFRDLLGATAKSPAMLFYLDNWMSADPNGPHADAAATRLASSRADASDSAARFAMPMAARPQAQSKNAPKGLNENYGRELMELHTLGVDGGYTQKDVTEVARAFTGWTIDNPRLGGGFMFEPRLHDPGREGRPRPRIKAGGGESDGEQVLDILAQHPSTARFIATKLARRFVSDTPPPALVDRAAARFRATRRRSPRGDAHDPDVARIPRAGRVPRESRRRRSSSSSARCAPPVRTSRTRGRSCATLQELGHAALQCQPPTGYKDTADAWMNTGALVAG